MEIQQISYSDITVYWDKLWPNRAYEPFSAMCYLNGYFSGEPENICYYAVLDHGTIAGVNSCHSTVAGKVRSRGLWVDSQYRGRGLGRQLLTYTLAWAVSKGYDSVWSFPKFSAQKTYFSVGFMQQSNWVTDSMGNTNCYVIRYLSNYY